MSPVHTLFFQHAIPRQEVESMATPLDPRQPFMTRTTERVCQK